MVDPEEFAAQVNYLAALGRMIVPRAFSFADGGVLFVGHEPFDAWELASLLPEEVESYEQEDAPGGFDPGLVVLGRGGYTKDSLRSVLGELEGSTRIVPQEGFLDELLFGHDWWGEESDSLRRMTDQHGGLQIARSVGVLAPVGLEAEPTPKAKIARPAPVSRPPAKEMPRTPEKAPTPVFSWPSTEAEETKGAIEGEEFDLRARSRLNELGPIRQRQPCQGHGSQTLPLQSLGLVFPSQVGTPLSAWNLLRAFKRHLRRAGLPETTRFHDLRHTCATLLLRQGVNPKFVQDLLGRADVSLTLNVYSTSCPTWSTPPSERWKKPLDRLRTSRWCQDGVRRPRSGSGAFFPCRILPANRGVSLVRSAGLEPATF